MHVISAQPFENHLCERLPCVKIYIIIKKTYSTFDASLKTLKPQLCDAMAFGTDDEQAVVDGFKNNLERSVNLLSELHLKKKIERKLQKLNIRGEIKRKVIADIFGESFESVRVS